jgi:hypothetical protein
MLHKVAFPIVSPIYRSRLSLLELLKVKGSKKVTEGRASGPKS